jgi:hypothetical protein
MSVMCTSSLAMQSCELSTVMTHRLAQVLTNCQKRPRRWVMAAAVIEPADCQHGLSLEFS